MNKILFFMAISLSLLSALNVQKASKDELICIKGIGEKKATLILKYRKLHKLKSTDDLLKIKGFGKVLVNNVEKDVKTIACGGKKSSKKSIKKSSKKETVSKKKSKKTESRKKDSLKKTSTTKSSKKIDSKRSEDKK